MAHHVTEANPTHHIAVCGETVRIPERGGWFHMCGLLAAHGMAHRCGECGGRWFSLEIVEETDRQYHFNGDEADEVWMDKP